MDFGHVRERCGRALGADHLHFERVRLAREFLTDGAETEDAERLAGERLRNTPRPAVLPLIERALEQRFRQEEERREYVLRHLYAVRPACARKQHVAA